MEWVKLYAIPAYYHDPALLRAGEAAEVLFCRALAHCGQVESRGLVDKTVLPMLVPAKAQARADALVREGLWVDEGSHYRVRSWDRLQDEHDAAADKRKKDRERKREHRRKARESEDGHADVSRGQSVDSHADSPALNRDGHDVDVERDAEREEQPTTSVVAASRPKPPRATRIPDAWPPDPETGQRLASWAAEHCPGVAIRPETDNWQDWHRAKGDTAKDWVASWRTWMRRAQKDADKNNGATVRALRSVGRVAEGDAILAEAFHRAHVQPELGA